MKNINFGMNIIWLFQTEDDYVWDDRWSSEEEYGDIEFTKEKHIFSDMSNFPIKINDLWMKTSSEIGENLGEYFE